MEITLKSGQAIKYDLPDNSTAKVDSFFIFSLHKCGSTLTNKIVEDICINSSIPVVNIPSFFFNKGIPPDEWQENSALERLLSNGYCYSGYRFLPKFLLNADCLYKWKKIFVFRDPRDALVSFYFSEIYNHPVPSNGKIHKTMIERRKQLSNQGINTFVMNNASMLKSNWNLYLSDPKIFSIAKIFRYEDIIFNKNEFAHTICDYLGINWDDSFDDIVKKHDIFPKMENKNNFIRKVIPGDHTEKLNRETISWLNVYFYDILTKFKYQI